MDKQTQLLRWRLILGKEIQKELEDIQPFTLSPEDQRLDTALSSIYGSQDDALGDHYPSFKDNDETSEDSQSNEENSVNEDVNEIEKSEDSDESLEMIPQLTLSNKEDSGDEAEDSMLETDVLEVTPNSSSSNDSDQTENSNQTSVSEINEVTSQTLIKQRIIKKYAILQKQSNISLNNVKQDNSSTKSNGSKDPPYPVIAKWIGDLYHFFDNDTVTIIQTDAVERKGLKKLLFEPNLIEKLEPNIKMLSTLLTLKDQIPQESKSAVKNYIKKVVEQIDQMLSLKLQQSIKTAINKRSHSVIPSANAIDFPYTIKKNLKNYSKDLNTIIPEHIYFFEHTLKKRRFHIILDIDQSGSMYESVIYASVISCILASVKSLRTNVILFSTEVVDISVLTNDPVELLYGLQIGGGTDIAKSLNYCQNLITNPETTIVFLISDLYEGGDEYELVRKAKEIKDSGATLISILSISDEGTPDYNERIAQSFAHNQIPCFACMPEKFPELLKNAIQHLPLNM